MAITNAKGGSGKSTIAVSLAEAGAERYGRALLVDADSQATVTTWGETALEAGEGLRSAGVALPTRDLVRRLEAIGAERYELTVIDTPPGDVRIMAAALEAADVVLVPARPTPADMQRVWATVEAAETAGKRPLVVLCQVRASTRSLAAAEEVLAAEEQRAAATVFPQREAIATAFGTRPKGILLELGHSLLDEIEDGKKK